MFATLPLLIMMVTHLFCVPTIYATIVLPPLLGPYQVGTRRIEVVDQNRLDPLAPMPQPRIVMLQLWYPISNSSSSTPAPWLPPNAAAWVDQAIQVPAGTFEEITTNTWTNGTAIFPLTSKSNAKLPVVVFSPGSGSLSAFYTSFTSSLASYGFIVVGVDHPYDSEPLELPNGTLLLDILTDANNTLAAETRGNDVTWLATQLTLRNIFSWLNVDSQQCPELRSLPNIDVKLGIFGHSIGGTTAALAMQFHNTSYASAASLDGPFYGPILTDGFQGPFFYMAANNSGNHAALQQIWGKIEGWKEAVAVGGSMHDSFLDAVVLVPQVDARSAIAVAYGKEIGTIEGDRMVKIVTQYVKAFWDWTLLGQRQSSLLKGEVKEFPEVVFEIL